MNERQRYSVRLLNEVLDCMEKYHDREACKSEIRKLGENIYHANESPFTSFDPFEEFRIVFQPRFRIFREDRFHDPFRSYLDEFERGPESEEEFESRLAEYESRRNPFASLKQAIAKIDERVANLAKQTQEFIKNMGEKEKNEKP